MAATSPDSDVSSTTVQVTNIGGQQIFQSGGQQYLIVNKAGSGGRIQIVDQQDSAATRESGVLDAIRRREILARQPSYCKILNDLKEVESSESEDQEIAGDVATEKQEKEEVTGQDLVMKAEGIEVVDGAPSTQTVMINGTQYQIVTPVNLVSGSAATPASAPPAVTTVHYSAAGSNGSSTTAGSGSAVYLAGGAASSAQQLVQVQTNGSTNGGQVRPAEEQARKREIRLMKNREAARECRNKKKEYIKCLENRVAVLENQNKALIEELKSLKELYTGQKN